MKKVLKLLPCALFTALILIQILFGIALLQLDMLPGKYTLAVFALMAVCSIALALWIGLALPKDTVKARVSQILTSLLCIAGIIGFLFAKDALVQIKNTISNVTNVPVVSAIVQLYVRSEDPAQTIDDTAAYTFGVTDSFDWDNTQKAIDGIQEHLGVKLNTVNYPTVFAMVDALYAQEVDAIFMNSGYVDILVEMEAYHDFESRTRAVYEYAIMETLPPTEPTIAETQPSEPQQGQDDPSSLLEPFIIYLSGADNRNKITYTSRSDVNILVVVNPQTHQILLVNTPRDSYVANTSAGGAMDKLTHCGLYGINCSVSTLENLYDIHIDYSARINFTGFETLIDAIGGVTIYSDTAFRTSYGNCSIVVGENHLNGAQALGYARERHNLSGGERERGKNQMKIITAAIKKMLSGSLFTSYTEILDSLGNMFTTTFPQESISQLVKLQLDQMPDWNITSYALNGTPGYDVTCSMPGVELYVLYPGEKYVAQASQLMQRVLDGDILTDSDLK